MSHYQPVAWMVYTQDGQSCYVTDNPADVLPNQRALPLYTEPFPTATHPAITHCDTCGCDWLDNGLNPIGCPYCKQSAEAEALRAEVERLSRYYKNGIACFANPCERHSGERTPPFAEFFEKYGGQCLICVVDNNKALQAENERLHEQRLELLARIEEAKEKKS